MLKKIYRLTKEKDFQTVYRRGRYEATPLFNVYYLPNRYTVSKFGIVINKKTAKKATERNLIKRRVREVLLPLSKNTKGNFNIVVSLKGPSTEKSFQELKTELEKTFKKAGLIEG